MVLGGQHLCRALKDLRSERMTQGPLPRWLQTVRATVLRTETDLTVRRLLAGR